MPKTITLDSIAAPVEDQYAPTDIPLLDGQYARLHPILRLGQKERAEFMRKQAHLNALQDVEDADGDEFEAIQDELLETLRELFRIVGRRHPAIDGLLDHFGDDFASLMVTFKMYAGETQAGEASASPAS